MAMGNRTGIEWTDATWNPIRGCSRVSEGCRNCYAERMAHRFSGAGQPFEGLTQLVNGHPAWTGKVALAEGHLLDPLKWKRYGNIECVGKGKAARLEVESRSRRIFVNSMSDLFHPNVPEEWIDRIFAVMALCPQHTFQVLTKRPERMRAYCTDDATLGRLLRAAATIAASLGGRVEGKLRQRRDGFTGITLPNLHLGVSVEDQATAEERIPLLLQTPAAVRFVSAEPLLGGVNLRDLPRPAPRVGKFDALLAFTLDGRWSSHLDWVICGGESGPGARPMHPDWARGLRDQCVAAGVPFFFKQWGEWAQWDQLPGDLHAILSPEGDVRPEDLVRVGKKAAGSLLDGREWKEFPR